MTTDIAQTNLKEPDQVDWDTAFKSSSYTPPPPAFGPDGKRIIYYGILKGVDVTGDDQGYLNLLLDPIVLTKAGSYDGYTLRFTRGSTRPFEKNGQVMKGNPNKLASFLRSTGLPVRPTTNAQYLDAVKAVVSRGIVFPFVGDWEAYNKDTGERIKGYLNFPEDPERPGTKKSILKAGDAVVSRDSKGNITGVTQVASEVLFANFRLTYFQDPSRSK